MIKGIIFVVLVLEKQFEEILKKLHIYNYA